MPGSWNEQFDVMGDYLDMSWYKTETFIPTGWKGQRIFIRLPAGEVKGKRFPKFPEIKL